MISNFVSVNAAKVSTEKTKIKKTAGIGKVTCFELGKGKFKKQKK